MTRLQRLIHPSLLAFDLAILLDAFIILLFISIHPSICTSFNAKDKSRQLNWILRMSILGRGVRLKNIILKYGHTNVSVILLADKIIMFIKKMILSGC